MCPDQVCGSMAVVGREVRSMRRVLSISILLNCIALIVFLGSCAYVRLMLPVSTSRHVTALDRAGVFCEEKLRAFDPYLAANLRSHVGPYIVQDYRQATTFLLIVGIASSALTLVGLLTLRRVSLPNDAAVGAQ